MLKIKKRLWILVAIVMLVPILFLGIEYNNKLAFSTGPEEVLYHSDKNTYSIQQIVHQEIFSEDKYAYILFLTEDKKPEDSIVLAEFKKTITGWELEGMVLNSLKGLQTVRDGKNRTLFGLAPSDVETVKLGERSAQLFSIGENKKKIWIIYKPSKKELDSLPTFYNKEGQKLS
ncbi:hypothetical protein ACOZ9X_19630 [Fictibacillus nanhaiensis]